MSETRKRDRIIALVIAIFFLGFASLLSIFVIYDAITTKNKSQDSSQTTPAAKTLAGTQLTGFTPVNKVDKLKIVDTTVGTGAVAKSGDAVTVNYTGAVASTGVIFQSTQDTGQPASLDLNSVIKGWQEGIPGMKVGGTRQLLIPAAEAYGANSPQGSGIPANSDLVFDIQLVKIGS
jgi:FKBP-type peptidyl-prolyl cis-trans isomerase